MAFGLAGGWLQAGWLAGLGLVGWLGSQLAGFWLADWLAPSWLAGGPWARWLAKMNHLRSVAASTECARQCLRIIRRVLGRVQRKAEGGMRWIGMTNISFYAFGVSVVVSNA